MVGCDVCSLRAVDQSHKNSFEHKFNHGLWQWKHYKKALYRDSHGVVVTAESACDTFNEYNNSGRAPYYSIRIPTTYFVNNPEGLCVNFKIRNKSQNRILLMETNLLHPYFFKLVDTEGLLNNNQIPEIPFNGVYRFSVQFVPEDVVVGIYKVPVAIRFQCHNNNGFKDKPLAFNIARQLVVVVSDDKETKKCEHHSPFTANIWKGIKEWVSVTKTWKLTEDFPIPQEHRRLYRHAFEYFKTMTSTETDDAMKLRTHISEKGPTWKNYADFFHTLLWLNESAEVIMLEQYNMENGSKMYNNY